MELLTHRLVRCASLKEREALFLSWLEIGDDAFRYPVGQSLTVVGDDQPFLVACVLDIAQLQKDTDRVGFPQDIQVPFADRAAEAPVGLVTVVFGVERMLQFVGNAELQQKLSAGAKQESEKFFKQNILCQWKEILK